MTLLSPFETDVTILASQMQENTELLVRFRDNIFAILNGYSSLLWTMCLPRQFRNLKTDNKFIVVTTDILGDGVF